MPLMSWQWPSARLLRAKARASRQKVQPQWRSHLSLLVECLEAREVPTGGPSGTAATLFDLVNRMRTDPQGELMRLLNSLSPTRSDDPAINASLEQYGVNGSALLSLWSTLRPVAPLAWSDQLAAAAALHNSYMIACDEQSHQLPGEPSLAERVTNAGYVDWTDLGENVYAYAQSLLHAHAAFVIDWGEGPNGLQQPAVHRDNIMNDKFTEYGIAATPESNPASRVGPYVVTQNFGARLTEKFILGNVVLPAKDGGSSTSDSGLLPLQVEIIGKEGPTVCELSSSGFFQLPVTSGIYQLTFSGGLLATPLVRHVVVDDNNVWVKVDATSPEAVNHAPELTPYYMPADLLMSEDTRIPEAVLVSSMLGNAFHDLDAESTRGIAVYEVSHADHGAWQYSLNNGGSWNDLESATFLSSRLLDSSALIRFIPDADFSGEIQLGFRAWDGSVGHAGVTANSTIVGGSTAYSLTSTSFHIQIQAVNDAPVLDITKVLNFNPASSRGVTASARSVAAMLADSVSDQDQNASRGIAVVYTTGSTLGTWQFSLDGGLTWSNLGAVSAGSARLLRGEDWLRFIPRVGSTGNASLYFRAWDQTTGIAGDKANLLSSGSLGSATAYSSGLACTSVVVNNAPRLNATAMPVLTTILEDASNPAGDLVASFASSLITDADPNQVKGIAITGMGNTANGVWQFSLYGSTWITMDDIALEQALLLRGRDRVRFIPNPDFFGSATLQFHAWDGTSGNAGARTNLARSESRGGATAFSSDAVEAILAIAPVNDAPILDENGQSTLTPVSMNALNPRGDKVAKLLELVVQDPDPSDSQGVAIIGLTGVGNGTWQYSMNDGRTWTTIRNVSGSRALLLRDVDRIRFVPNRNFRGQASLIFRAWDQTTGVFGDVADLSLINSTGGITAFSSGTLSGSVVVG